MAFPTGALDGTETFCLSLSPELLRKESLRRLRV